MNDEKDDNELFIELYKKLSEIDDDEVYDLDAMYDETMAEYQQTKKSQEAQSSPQKKEDEDDVYDLDAMYDETMTQYQQTKKSQEAQSPPQKKENEEDVYDLDAMYDETMTQYQQAKKSQEAQSPNQKKVDDDDVYDLDAMYNETMTQYQQAKKTRAHTEFVQKNKSDENIDYFKKLEDALNKAMQFDRSLKTSKKTDKATRDRIIKLVKRAKIQCPTSYANALYKMTDKSKDLKFYKKVKKIIYKTKNIELLNAAQKKFENGGQGRKFNIVKRLIDARINQLNKLPKYAQQTPKSSHDKHKKTKEPKANKGSTLR